MEKQLPIYHSAWRYIYPQRKHHHHVPICSSLLQEKLNLVLLDVHVTCRNYWVRRSRENVSKEGDYISYSDFHYLSNCMVLL
jgi:hypothetical protein